MVINVDGDGTRAQRLISSSVNLRVRIIKKEHKHCGGEGVLIGFKSTRLGLAAIIKLVDARFGELETLVYEEGDLQWLY